MKRNMLQAILVTAVMAGLAACGSGDEGPGERVSAPDGSFTRITPAELVEVKEDQDLLLVNVHIPYEGELPGTDLFIPFDEITGSLDQLPSDRSSRVVLYCQSGRMSTEAAQELVALGFTDIWELGGGMIAWREEGLALAD